MGSLGLHLADAAPTRAEYGYVSMAGWDTAIEKLQPQRRDVSAASQIGLSFTDPWFPTCPVPHGRRLAWSYLLARTSPALL